MHRPGVEHDVDVYVSQLEFGDDVRGDFPNAELFRVEVINLIKVDEEMITFRITDLPP